MNESRYREVETLRDDCVVATITKRIAADGKTHFSFRLQREFEQNGKIKVTSYLGRRHIPAVVRIVGQVQDRIDILSDQAKLARAQSQA